MNLEDAAKLPFEMQLVLVAGYLGYRVATGGLDRTHKPTDTVFQVLAYGLVAYLAYSVLSKYVDDIFSMPAAVITTLVAAGAWRRWGRGQTVDAFRLTKITRENYMPSTWDHLIHERHPWSYVSVLCDDNTVYESNIDALPLGLPFDPLDVDGGGNIALYVTRMISAKQAATDYTPLDDWGRASMTYIPANRIRNITISFGTSVSRSSAVSAVAEAGQQSATSPG